MNVQRIVMWLQSANSQNPASVNLRWNFLNRTVSWTKYQCIDGAKTQNERFRLRLVKFPKQKRIWNQPVKGHRQRSYLVPLVVLRVVDFRGLEGSGGGVAAPTVAAAGDQDSNLDPTVWWQMSSTMKQKHGIKASSCQPAQLAHYSSRRKSHISLVSCQRNYFLGSTVWRKFPNLGWCLKYGRTLELSSHNWSSESAKFS